MRKKKIVKKKKVGRPSKKDSIDLDKVAKLCIAGCTQEQVAIALDISLMSITNYMRSDKKFLCAIKDNSALANSLVKNSLFKRAMGYEYDEITYEKTKTGGMAVIIKDGVKGIKHVDTYKTKVVTKKVAPDVTAQIFWLANRDPENWKRGDKEASPKELFNEEIEILPTQSKSKNKKTSMLNRIGKYIN